MNQARKLELDRPSGLLPKSGGRSQAIGLYYKHVTIVNDDSSVISKWSFKLIDDTRLIIYDHNMFLIQAPEGWGFVRPSGLWKSG